MRYTYGLVGWLLLSTMLACVSSPCGSDKVAFLSNFDDLLADAKAETLPLNDPGWEQYDERFRALVEECYDQHEADLTGGEKRRFWLRSLGYYKRRFGDAAARQWLGRLGRSTEVE